MNKRLIIVGLVLLAVGGYFWTQSRYPALNKKLQMNGRVHTQQLSFDTRFDIESTFGTGERILYGTLNWLSTNRQGMTFGITFGAIMLTILKLIPPAKKENSLINSLKGFLTGTPLGVCANCVTPIGKGMYDSGSRIEYVLSTMISSPTMNVIVLTMLFSLFPFSFALVKVTATLVLALLVVPVVSKYFFKKENKGRKSAENFETDPEIPNERWPQAVIQAFKMLLKNLWFIIKTTGPAMVLAGFLGIVAIELVPLDKFVFFNTNPLSVVLVALVGALIPAPMTFDVIVAYTLNSAGLNSTLTMIFLFTAGAFSIYPTIVLAQHISKKVSATMFSLIMLFGIGAGLTVGWYDNYRTDKAIQIFDQYYTASSEADTHG